MNSLFLSLSLALTLGTQPARGGDWAPERHLQKAISAAVTAGAESGGELDLKTADLAGGEQLYSTRCVACHGTAGDGRGPAAAVMDPKPADFTDAGRWAASSLQVKAWIIDNGVKGTGMAPTGLSDEDTLAVLAYVANTFQGLQVQD